MFPALVCDLGEANHGGFGSLLAFLGGRAGFVTSSVSLAIARALSDCCATAEMQDSNIAKSTKEGASSLFRSP
jgi:hypothetical protein